MQLLGCKQGQLWPVAAWYFTFFRSRTYGSWPCQPSAERYFSSFVVVFSLCERKNDNSWSYAVALFRIARPHVLPAAAWDVPIVGVRFFRATRGKTAHKEIGKYHAAAGKNTPL